MSSSIVRSRMLCIRKKHFRPAILQLLHKGFLFMSNFTLNDGRSPKPSCHHLDLPTPCHPTIGASHLNSPWGTLGRRPRGCHPIHQVWRVCLRVTGVYLRTMNLVADPWLGGRFGGPHVILWSSMGWICRSRWCSCRGPIGEWVAGRIKISQNG
jgi:hypothetical protein